MDIPKSIITLTPTTAARAVLLAEISVLTKSVYHTDSDLSETLKKDVRAETREALTELWDKNHTPPQQREATLTALKEALLKLPLLHLSLAFEPSQSGIETFAEQARSLFNPAVLLDIVIDPALFGGAQVSYNGRYTDLSLEAKMETYFAGRKKSVNTTLSK